MSDTNIQKFSDTDINETLSQLKNKEEESLIIMLAEKYKLPYIDLRGLATDPEALRTIEESVARDSLVAPFKIVGKKLYVAIFSPQNDKTVKVLDELHLKGHDIVPFMASHASLIHVWGKYEDLNKGSKIEGGLLDLSAKNLNDVVNKIITIEDLRAALVEAADAKKSYRVSRIIELIIAGSLHFKASDIHIEPEEDKVRIRYRIDGVLIDICFTDHETMRLINSRLKLLSGLKLSTVQNAQDGRFSIEYNNTEIEVRVSLIPGNYGESFVMRLLDPSNIAGEIEDLGMTERLFELVNRHIQKPNGVILTTGPTGSGKSTTLYAFLKKIYNPEIKIVTIEDPIEYHLDGITQTQVETEKDYTFLSGLRSVLRQDPDVIMVGEIRDADTAKVAINAALTGHLVFSTLHTNTAAGTIPRLIELEVNPKILASSLNLSLAQRLVRKLCPNCKEKIIISDDKAKLFTNIIGEMIADKKIDALEGFKAMPQYEIYKAVGCNECHNGYKGRVGIFEAIYMDRELELLLDKNPSEREIKEAAIHQGIATLREDALVKILKGITSYEEASKVVDFYEK